MSEPPDHTRPYPAEPYPAEPYPVGPYPVGPYPVGPYQTQPYQPEPYQARPYQTQSYQPEPYPAAQYPPAGPGPYYPAPLSPTSVYPAPVQETVLIQFGEIQVTSTTVRTPAGQFPLRGSHWLVTDQWVAEMKTPTWAIVLAVVGFFCLTVFSLFFLLAKTSVLRGVVQVQVSNGPHHYVTRIPVTSQAVVHQLYQQVNYVRALSTM